MSKNHNNATLFQLNIRLKPFTIFLASFSTTIFDRFQIRPPFYSNSALSIFLLSDWTIMLQRLVLGFHATIVMKCLIIIINRYLLSQCRSLSELVLKWALRDFLPKFTKVLVTGSSAFRLGNYRLSDRKQHRWKR